MFSIFDRFSECLSDMFSGFRFTSLSGIFHSDPLGVILYMVVVLIIFAVLGLICFSRR